MRFHLMNWKLSGTRKQVEHESDLKRRDWQGKIETKSLEVPYDSEAFKKLYHGSSCCLVVPEYIDPNTELVPEKAPRRQAQD